jgi:hypothetical protein
LTYTPHDFRRLFATDALRSGLPPHIAAKILGHIDVGTTLGYAAIYPEDVVAHHRDFIARRRALRPAEEYRTLTAAEWDQFLQHPVDCTTSRSMTGLGLVWWKDMVWSRTCGGNWPKGDGRSRRWELWSRARGRTCRS